jgi:hypothetical protein
MVPWRSLYTKMHPVYALGMNFKSHEGKQGPMARGKEVIPPPPPTPYLCNQCRRSNNSVHLVTLRRRQFTFLLISLTVADWEKAETWRKMCFIVHSVFTHDLFVVLWQISQFCFKHWKTLNLKGTCCMFRDLKGHTFLYQCLLGIRSQMSFTETSGYQEKVTDLIALRCVEITESSVLLCNIWMLRESEPPLCLFLERNNESD